MCSTIRMGFLILLFYLTCIYARSVFEAPKIIYCDPDSIVAYKMVLKTFWTEKNFPKDYPTWRPPAQWSTIFGQSHGEEHNIFRNGQYSSQALQQFAEQGELAGLVEDKNTGSIYDQFISEAITQGAGESTQDFFVDGNHSMVSVVCKLVPSPDWFVGVDSYNFCDNGEWVNSVSISVDPLDAGTDGGLSFTSPNWRSRWPLEITRHTSTYPAHQAAAFYYPDLDKLPKIAMFQFIKLKEYSLSKLVNDSKTTKKNIIKNNPVDFIDSTGLDFTASFVDDEWNKFEESRGPNIRMQIPRQKTSQLADSASEILSNVTKSYQYGEGFYPKRFRPDIDPEILKKKLHSPQDTSNLQTSFFNYKNTNYKPSKSSSHFNW